jgi:hypothetical protein
VLQFEIICNKFGAVPTSEGTNRDRIEGEKKERRTKAELKIG